MLLCSLCTLAVSQTGMRVLVLGRLGQHALGACARWDLLTQHVLHSSTPFSAGSHWMPGQGHSTRRPAGDPVW